MPKTNYFKTTSEQYNQHVFELKSDHKVNDKYIIFIDSSHILRYIYVIIILGTLLQSFSMYVTYNLTFLRMLQSLELVWWNMQTSIRRNSATKRPSYYPSAINNNIYVLHTKFRNKVPIISINSKLNLEDYDQIVPPPSYQ